MHKKQVILCADDEKSVLQGLRQELEQEFGDEFIVEVADSGEEAVLIFQELLDDGYEIPVVISDQLMPGMKGDELLIRIHKISPPTRTILLTGQASTQAIGNAVNQADLYRYIPKPWEVKDLVLTVEEAINSYTLKQELTRKIKILSDLNRLSKTISEEVNPIRLAEKLLQCVIEDLDADYGFLRIFVSEDRRYNLMAESQGGIVKLKRVLESDLNDSVPAYLLDMFSVDHNGQAVNGNCDLPFHLKHGTQAYYVAPVVKQHIILGVIYIEYRTHGKFFTPALLEYLNSLRIQVAISLNVALIHMNLEDKVAERTRTIEDKNRHILDSLQYAHRIQLSILPPVDYIRENLPDSFVIYQPKDIVSGDFYWFASLHGFQFLVAADCTGHGVPGAFMSVMGTNLLNQIIRERGYFETNVILNELHRRVVDALHPYKKGNMIAHEGMDLSICRFDLKNRKLSYSGANRPVYYIREKEILELKPDRNSIGAGMFDNLQKPGYKAVHLDITPGDRFYLFTDGITDQFGGIEGRKYSYVRLKDTLLATCDRPIAVQGQLLQSDFNSWRGTRSQIDDMLLIGVAF